MSGWMGGYIRDHKITASGADNMTTTKTMTPFFLAVFISFSSPSDEFCESPPLTHTLNLWLRLDRSQSLFYFVPQYVSYSQDDSTSLDPSPQKRHSQWTVKKKELKQSCRECEFIPPDVTTFLHLHLFYHKS